MAGVGRTRACAYPRGTLPARAGAIAPQHSARAQGRVLGSVPARRERSCSRAATPLASDCSAFAEPVRIV
jgi:hypothetical protein